MKPLGFFGNAFALTHGIRTADHDGIGVMDDAVTDGVSQCRFADLLVPAADFELRAEDSGCFLASALRNFEQIAGLGFLQWVQLFVGRYPCFQQSGCG